MHLDFYLDSYALEYIGYHVYLFLFQTFNQYSSEKWKFCNLTKLWTHDWGYGLPVLMNNPL